MKGGNRVVALINMGGTGSRFGGVIPKQYVEICDKPIYIYCLELFQHNVYVDDIYCICDLKYEDAIIDQCKYFGISKFKGCIQSGLTANESRRNGALAINSEDSDLIIFHDSVRIFVTQSTIDKLLTRANECGIGICGRTINADIFELTKGDILNDKDLPSLNVFVASMPFVCTYYFAKKLFNELRGNDVNLHAGPPGLALSYFNEMVVKKVESGYVEDFKITSSEDLEFANFKLNSI